MKLLKHFFSTLGFLGVRDFTSGWILMQNRKYAASAEKFERGLSRYPFHASASDAHRALCECYMRLHQYSAAKKALRRATLYYPQHAIFSKKLTQLEIHVGAFRDAALVAKNALLKGVCSHEQIDLLCESLLRAQAPQKFITRALEASGTEIASLSPITRILFELRFGTLYRARALLDQRFQASDETQEERLLFATFCLEQGKTLFARQLLRDLYRQNSEHPEITFRLAQSFVNDARFEDTTSALHLAVEASQKSEFRHMQAMHLAATLYEEKGETLLASLYNARVSTTRSHSVFGIHLENKTAPNNQLTGTV